MAILQSLRGLSERFGAYPRRVMGWCGLCLNSDDPATFRRSSYRPNDSPFAGLPSLPALGVDAHPSIFQFLSDLDTDTTNKWDEDSVGVGTSLTVQDERGGVAKVTTGVSDDDYYFYQLKYEPAKIVAGKGLWLDGFVKIADVDQADWFWGLSARLRPGNPFDGRVDAIGFYGIDGSANINGEARKDSTATAQTGMATLVDSKLKRLTIYIGGDEIAYFYVDDDLKKKIVTNLPDDEELAVSFGIRTGHADPNSLTVGRIFLIQDV